MRLIIITDDRLVAIDGEFVNGVDMNSMPEDIHAVQWYEDHGEIEFRDGRANEAFTDFTFFEQFVQLFNARKIEIKKATPPNEFSDWDENTNEWVVNPDKKATWDIKQQVVAYKKYLSDTDWYYARFQETGKPVPQDIVAKRIEARNYIQEHDV